MYRESTAVGSSCVHRRCRTFDVVRDVMPILSAVVSPSGGGREQHSGRHKCCENATAAAGLDNDFHVMNSAEKLSALFDRTYYFNQKKGS